MLKALRVGYNQYYKDSLFEKHLKYVESNLSVIDEITVFAQYSHYGYWDLEGEKKNAELLKQRIKAYREIGVKSVGLNIQSTLGHIDEGWDLFPKAPFRYQVDHNGVTSKACICPADKGFLEYVEKLYSIYADTNADFIWMDDDLRPGRFGKGGSSCYCDTCIAEFNQEHGTNFNRTTLIKAVEDNNEIKALWEKRKDSLIMPIFRAIKSGIQKVNPKIKIGYMSSNVNAREHWITESDATKLRPGGGFYKDDCPLEVFEKHFATQHQISHYPDYISDIQYEHEAFNYQTMEKSQHLSELETTLALMAGCSGILYNDDVFYDRRQTTDMLIASAKKWDVLEKANKNCLPFGVYCPHGDLSRHLNEIGISVTAYPQNAVCAAAIGTDIKKMSDNEVRELLTLNLFTDGQGLEILNSRGFGEKLGGKVKAVYDNGMAERFLTHKINGDFADYYRDVFMNFTYIYGHDELAYEFETEMGAEIISNLETISHTPLSTSLYRIEKDGYRFAADGYLMRQSIKSAAKKEQLLNLFDWLSKEKLPIIIKKPVKVMPSVMKDENGGMNIMLTNASFDATGEFECIIRGEGEFHLLDNNGLPQPLPQTNENDETKITIDNISPWGYILITNKI